LSETLIRTAAVAVTTSNVVNGVCYPLMFWKSRAAQKAFGIWYFITFYVLILFVFFYFYWRILIAIRRQATIMASHGAATGSSNVQSHQSRKENKRRKTHNCIKSERQRIEKNNCIKSE